METAQASAGQPIDVTGTVADSKPVSAAASTSAGQKALDELLSVRNGYVSAIKTLAGALRAIGNPEEGQEVVPDLGDPARETYTSFFSAHERLTADLRTCERRVTALANELAGLFGCDD